MAKYDNGNMGGKRPAADNQYGKSVSTGKTEMGKTDYKSQTTSKTVPTSNSGSKSGGGSGKISW